MKILLVDGTYELFRHYFAVPSAIVEGAEVAATRAVARSLLGELEAGHRHIAVATDTVVESFRNDLWEGYKTGEGIEPELWAQFPLLDEALDALGLTVWAMTEFEADDAMAAGAARASADPRVEQVLIASPDKDLAQAVEGERVVQLDRRRALVRTADEEGSAVRFDPVRDLVLASGLVEIGFEWHDGPAGRCLIRAPAQPTGRPGP